MLRQYFSKGTDLSRWTNDDLVAIPHTLNIGHAKHSAGRLPPKHWTNSYDQFNNPALRRPVESVQYTSEEFQKWCGQNGVTQSRGKVGVCWDNAVAENPP